MPRISLDQMVEPGAAPEQAAALASRIKMLQEFNSLRLQHVRAGRPGTVVADLPLREGKVVTKEGSLVEKFLVDKSTGWVQQVF